MSWSAPQNEAMTEYGHDANSYKRAGFPGAFVAGDCHVYALAVRAGSNGEGTITCKAAVPYTFWAALYSLFPFGYFLHFEAQFMDDQGNALGGLIGPIDDTTNLLRGRVYNINVQFTFSGAFYTDIRTVRVRVSG
ncbi:hypothetical protein BKA57DRAFT_541425 [Linnemannia elongata]|nr:hypothetical protein BKA57DRAFT_541425 [Linnemannia elongata]